MSISASILRQLFGSLLRGRFIISMGFLTLLMTLYPHAAPAQEKFQAVEPYFVNEGFWNSWGIYKGGVYHLWEMQFRMKSCPSGSGTIPMVVKAQHYDENFEPIPTSFLVINPHINLTLTWDGNQYAANFPRYNFYNKDADSYVMWWVDSINGQPVHIPFASYRNWKPPFPRDWWEVKHVDLGTFQVPLPPLGDCGCGSEQSGGGSGESDPGPTRGCVFPEISGSGQNAPLTTAGSVNLDTLANYRANFQIPLGGNEEGESVGTIIFRAHSIDSTAYSPTRLWIVGNTDGDLIDSSTQSPITTMQSLALGREFDLGFSATTTGKVKVLALPDPQAEGFQIQYFDDASATVPSRVWEFLNPDVGVDTSRLQVNVLEEASGETIQSIFRRVVEDSDQNLVNEVWWEKVETHTLDSNVINATLREGITTEQSLLDPNVTDVVELSRLVDEHDVVHLKKQVYHEYPTFGRRKFYEVDEEGSWTIYIYNSTGKEIATVEAWKDLLLIDALPALASDYADPSKYSGTVTMYEIEDLQEVQTDGHITEFSDYTVEGVDKQFYTANNFLTTNSSGDTTTYPDGRVITRITDEGTFSLGTTPSAQDFVIDSGVAKRITTITGSAVSPNGLTDDAANGPTYTTWSVRIIDGEDRAVLEETWLWDGSATSVNNLPAGNKISGRYTHYIADTDHIDKITDHNGNTMRDETWVDDELTEVVDDQGITTEYLSYHDDGSVHEERRAGITTTYEYDAFDNLDTVTRSDGTYSFTSDYEFNEQGDLLSITDESGLTTTYSYTTPSGYTRVGAGRIEVVTNPDGGTQINDYYRDGQLAAVSGTAVEDVTYDYVILGGTADPDLLPHSHFAGWKKTVATHSNGKVVITSTDMLGREQEVVEPSPTGSGNVHTVYHYDPVTGIQTKVEKLDDAGNPVTPANHNLHNAIGEQIGTGIDVDGGGLTEASTDRLQKLLRYYQKINGNWWEVSEQIMYQTDGSATPTSQIYRSQVTGLASGVLSITQQVNPLGKVTTITTTVSGNVVTETTDLPDTSNDVVRVLTDGRLTSETTHHGAQTTYTYTGVLKQTDSATVNSGGVSRVTSYDYYLPTEDDPGQLPGRVKSTTNPHGAVTSYSYYTNGQAGAGNVQTQTQPAAGDGSASPQVTYTYNTQGNVESETGTGTYDKAFTYYDSGQMNTLTTVRAGSLAASTDITTWEFLPSGELEKKTYADETSIGYTYDAAGRLASRAWSGGIVTSYGYDPATGDLASISYSDNTQSVTFSNANRFGRPRQVTDAAGTRTLSYDQLGNVDTETYTSGLLAGVVLDADFDDIGRKLAHTASVDSQAVATHSFQWNQTNGLLDAVLNAANVSGGYEYLPNSNILDKVHHNVVPTPAVMTREYDYTRYDASFASTSNPDQLNRVGKITNTVNATSTVASSHTYHYDDLDRRQGAKLANGSRWDYGYDLQGQLTMANRYDNAGDPVVGQQFGWSFDEIGNFTGTGLSSNELNQQNPASKTVRGESHEDAEVFVEADIDGVPFEEQASEMHWGNGRQLWWQDLPIDNSAGPKSVPVTVTAVMTDPADPTGTTVLTEEKSGTLEVAAASQSAEYDLDGNTTLMNGEWIYRWNGENRLKEAETVAPEYRLAFEYDYQGRRVRKQVWEYDTQTSAYPAQPTVDLLFLYDDWNLVAEIDNTASPRRPIRTHLWGQDISGTLQGAGGVGGLIATTHHTYDSIPTTSTYFVAYDGNGNVMALVDAADGSLAAEYDYDAWGNLLSSTGPTADSNPFRFSTKYESGGNYYYGFRYYNPPTRQWLSRDPIGERGGVNIYSAANNALILSFDVLGLFDGSNKVEDYSVNGCCKRSEIDKIVVEALRKSMMATINDPLRREYCGLVCCNKRTGKVKASEPQPGAKPLINELSGWGYSGFTCNPNFKVVWRKTPNGEYVNTGTAIVDCEGHFGYGYKAVAGYHSHPPFKDGDRFSPADIKWGNVNKLPLYLIWASEIDDGSKELLEEIMRGINPSRDPTQWNPVTGIALP